MLVSSQRFGFPWRVRRARHGRLLDYPKKNKILEDGYILCGEKCCRFVSSLGCFGLVGEEL